MSIKVKILIIPGTNEKTFMKEINVSYDHTLLDLLNTLKALYDIDLIKNTHVIALLDGRAIDIAKDLSRNIKGCNELMVMPMISGG